MTGRQFLLVFPFRFPFRCFHLSWTRRTKRRTANSNTKKKKKTKKKKRKQIWWNDEREQNGQTFDTYLFSHAVEEEQKNKNEWLSYERTASQTLVFCLFLSVQHLLRVFFFFQRLRFIDKACKTAECSNCNLWLSCLPSLAAYVLFFLLLLLSLFHSKSTANTCCAGICERYLSL